MISKVTLFDDTSLNNLYVLFKYNRSQKNIIMRFKNYALLQPVVRSCYASNDTFVLNWDIGLFVVSSDYIQILNWSLPLHNDNLKHHSFDNSSKIKQVVSVKSVILIEQQGSWRILFWLGRCVNSCIQSSPLPLIPMGKNPTIESTAMPQIPAPTWDPHLLNRRKTQ